MSSKDHPYSIGIIGCGRISQSYVEAISRSNMVSLNAVMDVRVEAANALAEESGATGFYDLDNYLKKADVKASILCTPPHSHHDICTKLLEAGHHVLCEKPLATGLNDGLKMMSIAKKCKRHLMMASKFRYVEDVVHAKGMIASGLIGNTIYYENNFSGFLDMSGRWNSNPAISGGGVLVDNGTHSVDIVRYLIGPIKAVRTRDLSTLNLHPAEDTIELSFSTVNDIKGTIYLSWNIPLDRNAYIALYGSEGRLRVNWKDSGYQRSNQNGWLPFGKGYDKVEAFKKQVENFIETVQEKAEPLISDHDSLASLAVIEASYKSLKSGNWENVSKEYT